MSLWQRLTGRGSGFNNASKAGPGIAAWSVGQPVWTPRNYRELADEGFIKNAIGYRCTKMIAEAAAGMCFKLMKKTAEIEQHPSLDLLAAPAPMIGGKALFEAFYAYLLLEGDTYLEGVTPFDNRPPAELWALRPDRMRVIPGDRGMPRSYRYQVNGIDILWDVDQITGRGPIMHLREFHPLNDWYGLSRIEPAAYGIDQHNEAGKHNKALLQNGARPSGALIFKPVVINGQAQSAPPDIIKAAEKRLEDEHSGPRNAGRPMALGGNIDWQEMGLSPKDMDFGAGKMDAARDICTSLGVPHILVVPGSSTFNNVALARLQLYEDTVLPLAGRALDLLNSWLMPRYGDGLRLVHDLDSVSALEPRRESKRAAAINLFKGQILKRDEARAMLGYDAVGGELGEAFWTGPPTLADPEAPLPAKNPAEGQPDQGTATPDTANAA
jgi:HK97 family phage portal protein